MKIDIINELIKLLSLINKDLTYYVSDGNYTYNELETELFVLGCIRMDLMGDYVYKRIEQIGNVMLDGTLKKLNSLIKNMKNNGYVTDNIKINNETFKKLYDDRIKELIIISDKYYNNSFKSNIFDNRFSLIFNTPKGLVKYVLNSKYYDLFYVKNIEFVSNYELTCKENLYRLCSLVNNTKSKQLSID